MLKIDLNKASKDIHQQNLDMGWWNGSPCIYTKMQLVSTEIAEATEGERKGLMDDHLPHRKMGEVELADALIRVLDLGGYIGTAYIAGSDEALNISIKRGLEIGAKHLALNYMLVEFSSCYNNGTELDIGEAYTILINGIISVSNQQGYDILSAMTEKIAYNQTRADHQLDNRLKKNGKAF